MKQIMLFLMAILLLTGCAVRPLPDETTEGSTAATQQTEPPELYVPNSTIEQLTGGAVRTYSLAMDNCIGLYTIGTNFLVVGESELLVLSGDKGKVTAKLQIDENAPISVMDTAAIGIAYYLPNTRQVVILNPQLQSLAELQLPEDIVGTPLTSLARNEVYYSTGKEIRALHINTGISRLLRQQSTSTQVLLGAYFDGSVLSCQTVDDNNNAQVAYISSVTGQTLSYESGIFEMQTHGENYFIHRLDGSLQQSIFGTRNGAPQCFLAPQPTGESLSGRAVLLAMNGVIDYVEAVDGLELAFYDLKIGKCTARVKLPGIYSPLNFCSDDEYIWIMAEDGKEAGQTLFRWNVADTPVMDDTIHIGKLYTAEDPDVQGLAQCREQADALEKKYKITLTIWNDAVKNTGSYKVTAEYHTEIISAMLNRMETALSRFPKNFLKNTVDGKTIRIALVRSIEGGQPWVQFWKDGNCHIIISAAEDADRSLYQGVAYPIDSHVLGNSRDYDTWNQLNPEGFYYAYNYDVNEKSEYLTGENQAFTDALAMSYPHEDRCRVFYHAMLENNADMFKSATMQEKLLRLCKGIREAYGLEKSTENYAWEQYLTKPLAYAGR